MPPKPRVWWHKPAYRIAFEHPARRVHPDLRSLLHASYELQLTVPVPGYDSRRVKIVFRRGAEVPRVYADGPPEPLHRYNDDGALCMWYPPDPRELRWVRSDGLRALIGLIAQHLFREAWWRQTGGHHGGEWLGVEAPHGPPAMSGAG